MSEAVKASLTITYNLKEDADPDAVTGIWMELDDELNTPDGETEPKTRFPFGEPVYFIVFYTDNIESVSVVASEGAVSGVGLRSIEKTEDITFAGTKTGSISLPASGGVSAQWRGAGSSPAVSVSGTNIVLNRDAIGILTVTYTASGTGYSHVMSMPGGYDTEEDPGYTIIVVGQEG
jgi:hypothetical protein